MSCSIIALFTNVLIRCIIYSNIRKFSIITIIKNVSILTKAHRHQYLISNLGSIAALVIVPMYGYKSINYM